MSRASFNRNGPRSGLSRNDSSISTFSGGDFFFPEPRSGDGFAREVDGDGGRRGAGEFVFGLNCSDLLEPDPFRPWFSSEIDILNAGVSGGVLTETNPGIATAR